MMNEKDDIILWYIDMIAEQGMDELEEALLRKDITKEQFNLAINTSNKLKNGLLSDIDSFIDFTLKCKEIVN